jgi:CDP-glycerol glycerophosphotransferase (TagB/SpsB family)
VLARARWFVNNVNFPDYYVKRDGTIHVQTHHGTPLKRMGMDQLSRPDARQDLDVDDYLARCMRWDFDLSSNHFSTDVWRSAYPVDRETLEFGYPRNDVLATATPDTVRAARQALGIDDNRKVVLFAPTHREYLEAYDPTVDLNRFVDALGDDWLLLTRLHYAYGKVPVVQRLHRAGRLLDVSGHPSIEQLFLAADALVTDYSSVMFDYAVLDRPIVVHAPDWEEYRTRRGTYFDLLAEPPGVVSHNDDELVEAFRSGAIDAPSAKARRADFRDRFCSLDDGAAAERVVRRVWLDAAVPAARA